VTANNHIAHREFWITKLEEALSNGTFTHSTDIEKAENKLAAYKNDLARLTRAENKKHVAKVARRRVAGK
jgi:hypothetical protein